MWRKANVPSGRGPWPWTGLVRMKGNRAEDQAGGRYFLAEAGVAGQPGWRIVYLHDLQALSERVFRPLARTGGTVILMICVFMGLLAWFLYRAAGREIRRRAGAEAELKVEEALLDNILAASPVGIALVERRVVVISGLAEGIDTAAHHSAIACGGWTIAVLGTPLDKVYPKKNRSLQDLLSKEHLAVSQFPPGSKISKSNFPMRNRTMALICDLSVIVEAGETSGSHSQGWETLRLGRPLFLMKAVAEGESLKWPKEMMKFGAQVLSDDNLEDFFEHIPPTEQVEESMIAF